MDPDAIPDGFWVPPPGTYDDKDEPSSASLADSVDTNIKRGVSREDAVASSLPSILWRAMDEGTGLMELYGEGEISRKELLVELICRIPGSEMFTEELKVETWRITLINSDPQQAAAWTTALFMRRDMRPVLGTALNPSRDLRAKMRLEWNRSFAAGLDAGRLLPGVQSNQVGDWRRWFADPFADPPAK